MVPRQQRTHEHYHPFWFSSFEWHIAWLSLLAMVINVPGCHVTLPCQCHPRVPRGMLAHGVYVDCLNKPVHKPLCISKYIYIDTILSPQKRFSWCLLTARGISDSLRIKLLRLLANCQEYTHLLGMLCCQGQKSCKESGEF